MELSVRNSASYTMRHFIDIDAAADEATPQCEEIFLHVLFSGLKNGLRLKNEMVRMELHGSAGCDSHTQSRPPAMSADTLVAGNAPST